MAKRRQILQLPNREEKAACVRVYSGAMAVASNSSQNIPVEEDDGDINRDSHSDEGVDLFLCCYRYECVRPFVEESEQDKWEWFRCIRRGNAFREACGDEILDDVDGLCQKCDSVRVRT